MPSLVQDCTELLFWKDPYTTECKAQVIEITKEGLVLDKTIFFPIGGGQASDKGILMLVDNKQTKVTVTEVEKIGRKIVHKISEKKVPFSIGDQLIAKIDWQRRYNIMKAHTSQHLLSAVINKDTNIQTNKAIIDEQEVTVYLEKEISETALEKALIKANNLVISKKSVSTEFYKENEIPPDKLRSLRGHLNNLETDNIRIVSVEGLDDSLCGGTHCRSVSEIGIISLVDYKGGTIRYFVGEKAIQQLVALDISLIALAKELSVKKEAIPKRVMKQLKDTNDLLESNLYLSKEVAKRRLEDAKRVAEKINEIQMFECFLPHIDRRTALMELGPLAENMLVVLLLKGPILLILSSIKNKSADLIIKEINKQFGGKGGGSPTIAQTTIEEGIGLEDIRKIIMEIIK